MPIPVYVRGMQGQGGSDSLAKVTVDLPGLKLSIVISESSLSAW